jgi:hypothetical protein
MNLLPQDSTLQQGINIFLHCLVTYTKPQKTSSWVFGTFLWSRFCHLPVSLSDLSVLTLPMLFQRIFIHQTWPSSNGSKPPQFLSCTQYHIQSDAHQYGYGWHSPCLYLVKNCHRMQCQLPSDAEWLSNVGCLKSTRLSAFNLHSDAVHFNSVTRYFLEVLCKKYVTSTHY